MKRVFAAVTMALLTTAAIGQTKVGNMTTAAFKKINAQGPSWLLPSV